MSVEVVSSDYVYIYVGGMEVHRELQAPAPPATVRAGSDLTLPEYTASYTLRGAVDRITARSTGYKSYELKDHLGNVRVVVSDQKQTQVLGDGNLFVRAAVRGYSHYYPFGMAEPGGTFQAQGAGAYRYGYNGKELDRDFQSNYDYGFRIYNAGIAKFLSVDPLADDFPWYTPYQFAGNMPIEAIDLDGLEPKSTKEKEGFWEGAGKAVLEGSIKVVKYIYNNPSADGYGYHPGMKPASQARRAQYDIDWAQQLDPHRQIEAFAENAVMGPINLYKGVVNRLIFPVKGDVKGHLKF